MAIAPKSLNSGLDRAVKHVGTLRHQSGRGFQLVFLISNNLDGNTTDGNTEAEHLWIVIQHQKFRLLKMPKAGEVTTFYRRRSPKKLAVGSNGTTCRKNILQRKCWNDRKDRSPTIWPRHHQQWMRKSHGRGIWQRLYQFIESEEEQKELREQFREGKLNKPFISF